MFESSSKDYSEWFGYYNYDTLDSTHKRLLCNRADFDGIKPNSELKIELGYYDIVEKNGIILTILILGIGNRGIYEL